MRWSETFQWIAGAALLFYGLDELARQIGGLVEDGLSAWSERMRRYHGGQMLVGLAAGVTMQGRRGLDYIVRRRHAGLLSSRQSLELALGLVVGMFLPAFAIVALSPIAGYGILIAALVLRLMSRGVAVQSLARGLFGLGCCWFGYATVRVVFIPGLSMPLAGGVGVVGGFVLRAPVALWLLLAALQWNPAAPGHMAITAAAVALGWGMAGSKQMARVPDLFFPPDSLLDRNRYLLPEQAIPVVRREIDRLARGLARCARETIPALVTDGAHTGLERLLVVERVMNEFKPAAQRYLLDLAHRPVNEHQANLFLDLYRCVSDLERVADHVTAIVDYVRRARPAQRDTDLSVTLADAIDGVLVLIETMAQSFSANRHRAAEAWHRMRDRQAEACAKLSRLAATLAGASETDRIPLRDFLFSFELHGYLERIARHIDAIALMESPPGLGGNVEADE